MAFYRCVGGGGGADTSIVTALASDVLSPKVIVDADGNPLTGTMPNNGAVSPSALDCGSSYTIPAGYHNGSGKVTANSLASQTSADAVAGNILTGKTAWVNGSKVTGTMANRGAVSQIINAGSSYTIPAGYHNGSGKVTANSASTVTIDGVHFSGDLSLISELTHESKVVSNLPFGFRLGSAVVYNGELHILGGNYVRTAHYKFDGSSWTSVSTLPYEFYYSIAIVYNNEIHILGGSSSPTNHYKWNGSSWTSVSTLPCNLTNHSAVVYDNKLYILGTSGMYKWNGSSWTSVSTMPYADSAIAAVVYDNEIHILGGSSSPTNHYKWNGSSWTRVSTLPYNFSQKNQAVVYENEIHILGGTSTNSTNHYKWNGSSWTSVGTLPYDFLQASAVVYKGELQILGGVDSSTYKNHYSVLQTIYKKE